MVAFTPASDVWTLGYDQFDNICWQHKKTEGLYYIPPGQPLTLPPKGLTNMFRPNNPNNHRVTPNTTGRADAYSLRGLGGAIHFNNPVLSASETAGVWPVSFVAYTQHHSSPHMPKTKDGNQWLPQKSFNNMPRWDPNEPYFPNPATVRAEALSHQELGKWAHFNNSVLEVPKAARLQPASIIKSTKPQTRPTMPMMDEKRHGLPSRSLANAPLPNLRPELDLTSAINEHARSHLLSGDGGKHFDSGSPLKVPETASLRPAFIIEDAPHPPTQTSTMEDEKRGLPPMSSVNAPSPNLSHASHLIPTTKDRDREFLLPASIEEEHSDINSTLELPDVATVKTASVVDDTKSHISPSLSEAETPQLGSTSESLVTAPEDPPSIPATTESTEASLTRVNEKQEHPNINSPPEAPDAARALTVSVEDTNPQISSVLREGNTEQCGLTPIIVDITPCSNAPEDPYFAPSSTTYTETSLLWEDGKEDLFDSNSSLNVPEAVRVWPASTVDTIPHPSQPLSRMNEVDQWSIERDIRGKEYYVNIITGKSQYKKPDCLKKYARRR